MYLLSTPLLGVVSFEVHQFITYRGLMYEFGCYKPNEHRVQDPNDPTYEYNTREITGKENVGSSICTYEEVKTFIEIRRKYNLFLYNCQHFAQGLANYLVGDCKMPLSRKRSDSEEELARYIFSISGDGNCTDAFGTLSNSTATRPTASAGTLYAASALLAVISFTGMV